MPGKMQLFDNVANSTPGTSNYREWWKDTEYEFRWMKQRDESRLIVQHSNPILDMINDDKWW